MRKQQWLVYGRGLCQKLNVRHHIIITVQLQHCIFFTFRHSEHLEYSFVNLFYS